MPPAVTTCVLVDTPWLGDPVEGDGDEPDIVGDVGTAGVFDEDVLAYGGDDAEGVTVGEETDPPPAATVVTAPVAIGVATPSVMV